MALENWLLGHLAKETEVVFMSQTVKLFTLDLASDLYQWTSTLRVLLTHLLKCIKINFNTA